MQSTLAKQYQRRPAKGAQQLTHVEHGLRNFVAEAGWQVLGVILLPFCKLHGLTITHSMAYFAKLPLLIACFLRGSFTRIEFGDRCLSYCQTHGQDLE